jgi:hypothetical protein
LDLGFNGGGGVIFASMRVQGFEGFGVEGVGFKVGGGGGAHPQACTTPKVGLGGH